MDRSPQSPPDSKDPCPGREAIARESGWETTAPPVQRRKGRPGLRKILSRLTIPLAILCTVSVAFVGWEVIAHTMFPDLSTGMRHFTLTLLVALVTAGGCSVVYILMRKQQRRLSRVAEELTRLLESYMDDPDTPERFENPHLIHCTDGFDCILTDCAMHELPDERCWQVMALKRAEQDHEKTSIEIKKCHACKIYRQSCPDELIELGENFNNLLFLLGEESAGLERMRSQMVEKQKMVSIGQLASGIAHEVANPLSSISSIVQILKRSGVNGAMTKQFDLIQTHINRITGIVRKLGKLARPGGERWERINVGAALNEAVRLISFDQRAKNVDIRFDHPEDLTDSYGIPGHLDQVFINLCLNALDAMPDGGVLTIVARQKHDSITVEIRDTGCGVPPDVGRRIFEPFFTTKQPGRGTGLGLSVSYGIVQGHGGTIDMESNEGEGTAFLVNLPILHEPPDKDHGPSDNSSRR